MRIELLLQAATVIAGAKCVTNVVRLLLQHLLVRYLVDQAVKQKTKIEPADLLRVMLGRSDWGSPRERRVLCRLYRAGDAVAPDYRK